MSTWLMTSHDVDICKCVISRVSKMYKANQIGTRLLHVAMCPPPPQKIGSAMCYKVRVNLEVLFNKIQCSVGKI